MISFTPVAKLLCRTLRAKYRKHLYQIIIRRFFLHIWEFPACASLYMYQVAYCSKHPVIHFTTHNNSQYSFQYKILPPHQPGKYGNRSGWLVQNPKTGAQSSHLFSRNMFAFGRRIGSLYQLLKHLHIKHLPARAAMSFSSKLAAVE